jgi:putative ABC transport system permease protein
MESILQDLRFGLRSLAKTRGVTLIAVITLALGIGANTAIFSLINSVLLARLPFRDPGQLVRFYETEAAPGNYPLSPPDFIDWKTQNHTFSDMTLFSWPQDLNLSGGTTPLHVRGIPVEANFFTMLGVQPLLGRTFAEGEDQPGKDQVTVLSYALWQSQFGGDLSIVGRTIDLNAKPHTVIGVMRPNYRFPSAAQLWVPLPMDSKGIGMRGNHWASGIGRLKPGVTIEQGRADLLTISRRLEQEYSDKNFKVYSVVLPLHEDLVRGSRDALLMMMWAVALVLLIACANVANLLLGRAVARQREMAIRSALGAGRVRLVRQLLTESVLLGLCGAIAGFAIGAAALKLLTVPALGLSSAVTVKLDATVLGFTLGVSAIAGLLFGIFPALHTSRPDVYDELKGGAGSSVSHSRQRRFTSNALVVAEVGFSLLLLIASTLLLKDFFLLRQTDVGVRKDNVWTATINLPSERYKGPQKQHDFAATLFERLQKLPGVASASLSNRLPLEGGSNGYVKKRGQTERREIGPLVETHAVTPGYFETIGVPLIAGRDFTPADVEDSYKLDVHLRQWWDNNQAPPDDETEKALYRSVINQEMAKRFWPNENPIGQWFSRGDHGPWHEVVGVVGDVRQWGLTQPPQPEAYDAFDGDSRYFIVLHTKVEPTSITGAVRQAVSEVDSSLPLFDVRTMPEIIADNATGEQFLTLLIGIFAGLALLLAAVGIYGVLSYAVTQRTREIGIRMSLGADSGRVLRLILGQGMRLAVIGFALGIGGALAARKLLATSLHTVKANDPAIYGVAALALAVIALLACYVPARRAAKVDPMVALRYE